MTKHDPIAPRETLADMKRMLVEMRPEQIRRLMADILASGEGRGDPPERRAS